jgi:hypothetical protein
MEVIGEKGEKVAEYVEGRKLKGSEKRQIITESMVEQQ